MTLDNSTAPANFGELSNVVFQGNTASAFDCGGLWVRGVLTVTHSQFLSNTSVFMGGGGYVEGPSTLVDSEVRGNIGGDGGGWTARGTAFITRTTFADNVGTDGGGLWAPIVTVADSQFLSNTARSVGGGLSSSSALTVTRSIFIGNDAHYFGGGLIVYNSTTGRIVNSVFARNTVTDTAGGAALHLGGSGPFVLLHNTIVDPALNARAAISITANAGSVAITNTLIAQHNRGIVRRGGSVLEDYNQFFSVPMTTSGGVASGGHSLIGDPHFVEEAADNYHLQADSIAMGAGILAGVDEDLEGQARPSPAGFDIGAYQYPYEAIIITEHPVSQTISFGQSTTLSVTATGSLPLHFQWYSGLPGDTSQPIGLDEPSLTTPPLTATQAYWVQVSNKAGTANSQAATIIVASLPPSILVEPESVTIQAGQTATLTVVASGTLPLSFQWYQGTTGEVQFPVPAATSASFSTAPLTFSTSYWVRAINGAGHADSQTAVVIVVNFKVFLPSLLR
jgi:hypothetical protein